MTDWAAVERSAFARFAAPGRRDRMLHLVGTDRAKSRAKLATALAGESWFDPARATALSAEQAEAAWVEAELRRRGGGDRCRLVVAGREATLAEALEAVVGSAYGELVLVGTAEAPVAYLETELAGRFVLA